MTHIILKQNSNFIRTILLTPSFFVTSNFAVNVGEEEYDEEIDGEVTEIFEGRDDDDGNSEL
jgi:hypothetical protein